MIVLSAALLKIRRNADLTRNDLATRQHVATGSSGFARVRTSDGRVDVLIFGTDLRSGIAPGERLEGAGRLILLKDDVRSSKFGCAITHSLVVQPLKMLLMT